MRLFSLLLLLAGGCSIPTQSLRSLTIPITGATYQPTDKSFLLYPLEDERGGEFLYISPTTFMPLVALFHAGETQRYPEHGGLLYGTEDGKTAAATGGLDTAMPHLLGGLLHSLGVANAWAPVDSVDSQRDLSKFDYVIKGKLKRSSLRIQANAIPCGLLAILGVPFLFVDYELEYELILLKNAPAGEPLWRKTYHWSGKKVVGLYYHWTAYYDLFKAGLVETLPGAVRDLAAALPR